MLRTDRVCVRNWSQPWSRNIGCPPDVPGPTNQFSRSLTALADFARRLTEEIDL
jgi:hypothetical protein